MADHIHGRNNQHCLEYVFNRRLSSPEVSHYRQLCLDQKDNFKLSPGAINLLEFLTTNNILRTIATASEKSNVDFFRQHLNSDLPGVSQVITNLAEINPHTLFLT